MVLQFGERKTGPQIRIRVEASLHCFQSWCPGVWWSSFRNKGCFINIFHLLGVLVLQPNSKILLSTFLEEGPGPCPKAALLFLDCFSLTLHPLPSLITHSLNPPFGTQGRSIYSLKIKNRGHRKACVPRSLTGPCSVSQGQLITGLL